MSPGRFTEWLRGLFSASAGDSFAPTEPPSDGPFAAAAVFDPEWYVRAYSDVRAGIEAGSIEDALTHYRGAGGKGRDPNALFSESWYRSNYPDVAKAVNDGHFANGFEHFVKFGRADGRRPNGLVIDGDFYRAEFADAAADLEAGRYASAYEHYLLAGAAAGRDPHAAFSESWYRERHPDVAEQIDSGRFLSGYQHFLSTGLSEGRTPHPLFNETHYRNLHHDVDDEVRRGVLRHAYLHLIHLGLAEGRRWKTQDRSSRLREAATRLARCRLDEFLLSERVLDFSPRQKPEVAVLLVLFNRAELTLACLEALQRIADPAIELIVVDNDSSDRTSRLLERLHGVTVIQNDHNAGFVRAANQAAERATSDLLLFLNNDAEPLPSSLRAAIDRLQQSPDTGAVGGRVVGVDGRLEEAGSIVWKDGSTDGYGRGDDAASGAYLFPREVDYCSGAFLLTPRSTFEELGGFDDAFAPAYYEESDYCFRLRAAGKKVLYEPRSVILHHGSASLSDETELTRQLAKNRRRFTERHGRALAEAPVSATENFFEASDRRKFRGRVIHLDDQVPVEALGGGAPRAQEILHLLCETGYFVTFFATSPVDKDLASALTELPQGNLELIGHLGRPFFPEFWEARRDAYDIMIVSRWHNFKGLLEAGFDPAKEPVRLIYDAECVSARRAQQRLEILGADAPAEVGVELEEEVSLARSASEIWAVSSEEAELLGSPEHPAKVIAHGEAGEPGASPFGERDGILFVGRLAEEWNPNVDGLRWYLEEVHPRVIERLGPVTMTVVGQPGDDVDLPCPEGVTFVGRVEDLAPVYDQHRLFVAPTRFAAGIPKKVTGAAAHGLPVVATSLLVQQLEWLDSRDIVDGGHNDAARFAERLAELYEQKELWTTVRANALERIEKEHSRAALRASLLAALDLPDFS